MVAPIRMMAPKIEGDPDGVFGDGPDHDESQEKRADTAAAAVALIVHFILRFGSGIAGSTRSPRHRWC
jgi:hypothetical protein